ncbi:MAG: PEP-CTERM sorting domain-containing protein [Bryobacterales bacterium]|nr:PEP-CTERM sorting domain-containing protein [Bryobacterales bacterium]
MAAIAGMMLLFPAAPARADFISSVSLAGGIAQTSPGTFTLGYQFQVGALPYNVTAVGLWAGTPPSGEVVRIYENGTTTNTLVQSIMGSDPLSNDGTYRYVNLAVPVLLQANTVYNLVVDLLPGDQLLLFSTATSNDPNITYVQPIGDFGFGGGIFPTTDNVHLGPYLGATLQGEPAEQTPVPEPSSIPLFITGAGMICLACGWKRR